MKMTKEELRQTMMVCIETLQMMNGQMPGPEELSQALGEEYKAVLAEYLMGARQGMRIAAAA